MSELPMRDLTDPQALRAIAHPLRVRILEVVALSGPLTATEVADHVGESPANCSWHLRQLARYGFVEEAGGGTGRQRPWQLVRQGNRWAAADAEPELARAAEATEEVLINLELRALQAWLRTRRQEDPRWRDAASLTQSMGWCTPEELKEINDEMVELLVRYAARLADPSSRPAGSRPVRFLAWGVPAIGFAGNAPADPSPTDSSDA